MLNIFGFMTVNWINYGLSFVGGSIAWRLPLALQLVFILVLFLTVPWLPESPRWLIAHQREAEAKEIMAALAGKNAGDAQVLTLYKEIVFSVQYELEHDISWRELLRGKDVEGSTKTLRRLILGAGTQFIQQFEGINIMSCEHLQYFVAKARHISASLIPMFTLL